MSKVTYKSSRKKLFQVIAIVTVVYFLLLIGFVPRVEDKTEKMFWILGITSFVGIFLLVAVRKRAKEVCCPHCNKDLCEILEVSTYKRTDFSFCPFCGERIEVE